MNQYVVDTIGNITGGIKQMKLDSLINSHAEIDIVCEEHDLAYYMACGIVDVMSADCVSSVNLIFENGRRNADFYEYVKAEYEDKISLFDNYADFTAKKAKLLQDSALAKNHEENRTRIFFIANLKDSRYADKAFQAEKLCTLEKYLEISTQSDNISLTLVTILPENEALCNGIQGISEREYEVIYADKPEDSVQKYVIALENMCRKFAEKTIVKVARIDNIIGPMIEDDSNVTIQKFVRQMRDEKKIYVPENARKTFYSASYIKDTVLSVLAIALKGRIGNIYNVSSWHFNIFQLCYDLYTLFTDDKIDLVMPSADAERDENEFHVLNPRKLLLVAGISGKTINAKLRDSIHHIALATLEDHENYTTKKIDLYYGKIDRIRKLELDLVLQVDEICKKHNIKYFLAGGSMLGAVRHGGFIPWDDDMDIGMLPSDYKRFLEVCPPELSVDNYSYQSTDLEPASLYIHDKIRIKNTCFTTRYSNQFEMQNGVYIDVFVYYKTSDNPKKQQRHIRKILIMRRVLGMRWVNRPRKNIHYYKSKVMLPFMRLFKTPFYRHMYMKLLEQYEKKDTHYLIDGAGFNLKKVGAFPKEWFEGDVIYKDFEGHSLPILARYDDYLRHWYGDKYMELLPISKRTSVHDVIRIDLGEHLFDQTTGGDFHQLDFRGELYEKTRSELSGKTSE